MTLMGTSTNHRREANSRSLRKVVRSKRWNRATAYNILYQLHNYIQFLSGITFWSVDFLTILYEMSWKVTQLQPESRAPSRQQAGPGMKSHQIPRSNLRSYKSAKAEEFTFGLATFWPESQCQNSNLKDLKLMKEFMSPMSPRHSACIRPPVLLEPEFRPRTEAWTDPTVKRKDSFEWSNRQTLWQHKPDQ